MPPKNRSSGSRSDSPVATVEIKETGSVIPQTEIPTDAVFRSSVDEIENRMMNRMSDMVSQLSKDLANQVADQICRFRESVDEDIRIRLEASRTDRTPWRERKNYSPRKPRRESPRKEPVYWFDPLPPTSPVEQEVYLSEFDSDQEVARPTRPTPKPARLSLVDGLEAIQKRKMAVSTIQYYEQAPKPNFKLDTLKYSEVHAFVLAFKLHMLRYPTAPVQLQLLIDRRVQAHIMSTCMIMREDDFYAMNNTEILKCIQRTISPKNKKKF